MQLPSDIERLVVSRYASTDVAWIVATPKEKDRCDDRVALTRFPDRALLLLADGATGVGYGGLAADVFVKTLKVCGSAHGLESGFLRADREIRNAEIEGDTTGIALYWIADRLTCCSVGDSEAWAFPSSEAPFEITCSQVRKPRIGNGARPVTTNMDPTFQGVVICGSDGFWRWSDPGTIGHQISAMPPEQIPSILLANLVERLGTLDDDVSIAVMSR